jgi:hydrogenase maturation protease
MLIIGVDNSFRGDDGVGLAVIRRLGDYRLPEGVQVKQHTGDGTDLINLWENEPSVIIVDAAHSGGQPGTVYRFDVSSKIKPTQAFAQRLQSHSSHLFGVAEAIALACAINRLPQHLIVFAVEGAAFDYGAALSFEVTKAVDSLVKQILAECEIHV